MNNDGDDVMSESEEEYYKEYEAVKEDDIISEDEEDKWEEDNINANISSSEDEDELEEENKIKIIQQKLLAKSERYKKEIAALSKSVSLHKAKVAIYKKTLAKYEHQLAPIRRHRRWLFFRPQRMYLSQKKRGSAVPGLLKIQSPEIQVG